MQASDLGEAHDTIGDSSFRSTDVHNYNNAVTSSESQRPYTGSKLETSILANNVPVKDQLGEAYGGTINTEGTVGFAGAQSEANCQGETPSSTEANQMRLFGNLPDLIRLSEQVGAFDGKVVFIGHPNRDISAHQWSPSSFEWVNIGRYSHSRGKVEGSLASDRLRGIDARHDTIEYFKLAAENRQALVIENGRPKNQDAGAGHALRGGMGFVGGPHVSQGPSIKTLRVNDQAQSGVASSLHQTGHIVLTKDVLEDPFVVAASVSLTRPANGNRSQPNLVTSTGSLDFTYRFPTKMSADTSSVAGFSALSLKTAGNTSGPLSTSGLEDVAFGEEAATRNWSSLTRDARLQQASVDTAYRPCHDHSQTSTKIGDSQVTIPWYKDVTSDIERSHPVTQAIPPTRPVLSTNHISSSLNAACARPPAGREKIRTPESTASTVNASGVALHYSDSDGVRKSQQYEVANGLAQQAPTAQNFNGPFFTDSKPTTHDPTASLSVHVSEGEKLTNWFCDGQRPARQKEYAKSLIAAAVASDKSRHLGAIGEVSTKLEHGPYANTGPFVRLYENFSEYVEEHRNGGGQSYFTRRWKPAAAPLRNPGPEQSRSHFGKYSARPSWPGATVLRPSHQMWG